MATTKLRLHRDVETESPANAEQIPATFRFPEIPRGRGGRVQPRRATLVAGRVNPDAAAGEAGGVHADAGYPRPPALRLLREDGTVTTPDLVRQVEQTMEAMQARLDRLRRQAESPMRFPEPGDGDDRPTAA
ncbi:MAG: hypothetical protein KF869_09620 [Phycisphaeraceae bacterium]|nr:hypothetical protein [Phycisphaeraceae bacterium]